MVGMPELCRPTSFRNEKLCDAAYAIVCSRNGVPFPSFITRSRRLGMNERIGGEGVRGTAGQTFDVVVGGLRLLLPSSPSVEGSARIADVGRTFPC